MNLYKTILYIDNLITLHIYVSGNDSAIRYISFFDSIPGTIKETPLLSEATVQLKEYFAGSLKEFSLPLEYYGTPFQTKIWDALKTVSYGTTVSYKELAGRAGYPKAYRAAGNAVNRNPIAVILPCHRIIASDGTIGGFAPGPETKIKLMRLENISVSK